MADSTFHPVGKPRLRNSSIVRGVDTQPASSVPDGARVIPQKYTVLPFSDIVYGDREDSRPSFERRVLQLHTQKRRTFP